MTAPSIACQQLVELVTGYLDEALSPRDRVAVEDHLMACDDCAEYVAQMRELIARNGSSLTADADGDIGSLPAGMLDTLLEAFRQPPTGTR